MSDDKISISSLENIAHNNKDGEIKLPKYHRAKIHLWKYLNPNNLDSLLACFDIDDYDEFLEQLNPHEQKLIQNFSELKYNGGKIDRSDQFKIFSRLLTYILNLNFNDKKDRILIEKYYYLIKFALSQSFSKEKINALITLNKHLHDICLETSFGNLDETFDYFKNLLLCYSVHRPPHSLKIFTPKEVDAIIDYVLKSYFNQFKLYKFIYTPALKLELKFDYKNLPKDQVQTTSKQSITNEVQSDNNDEIVRTESKCDLDENERDKTKSPTYELKEFIKLYLNEKLEKMKTELTGDSGTNSRIGSNSANDKNKQKKGQSVKPKSPNKK
jgi:hypothetical protein